MDKTFLDKTLITMSMSIYIFFFKPSYYKKHMHSEKTKEKLFFFFFLPEWNKLHLLKIARQRLEAQIYFIFQSKDRK